MTTAHPLQANPTFRRLWVAKTSGYFAFQIATLGVSTTAISVLHASNSQVGLVNAAQLAAFLFLGLPAGAWVDRWQKKRTILLSSAARTLALAWIPAAWLMGILDITQLVIVSACIGIATVFFDIANQSLLPALVAPNQVGQANGSMEASAQVARIAGPGIGGWLMGVLSIPCRWRHRS